MKHTKFSLILVLGIVVISGCSLSPSTDDPYDNWRLPLDDYHVESTSLVDRAIIGRYIECVTGERPQLEYIPAWENEGPVFNSSGRRLFTQEIAQEYGYSLGPEVFTVPTVLDEVDLSVAREDPCWEPTLDSVPEAPDVSLAFTLAADAYNTAKTSEAVQKAVADWATCMELESFEFPDGVSEPTDMPGRTGDFNPYYQPGSDEIQLALIDATCREQSNYNLVFFQEEELAQRKLIESHQEQLADEKTQLVQLRSWARDYFD